MTKTERILKLASLPHSERKRRRKDKDLSDVEIKDFKHGSYICCHHLNQNGGLVWDICATITTLDCGCVIVDESVSLT